MSERFVEQSLFKFFEASLFCKSISQTGFWYMMVWINDDTVLDSWINGGKYVIEVYNEEHIHHNIRFIRCVTLDMINTNNV